MSNENEFVITREFNAPREVVFNVWSQADHLKHWWGPKGFKLLVTKLDFKPGGMFHYCLQSPDGKEMWGKFVYLKIVAPERIEFINSFSDGDGGTTRHPLAPNWPLEMLNILTLTESEGKTTLTLRGKPIRATEEECNTYYSNFESMNQGFGGTFDQLDNYLEKMADEKLLN